MNVKPPALAKAWLAWIVPSADREVLLGDLAEEFASRVSRDGERAARRWYWRQVRRSTAPTLVERLRPGSRSSSRSPLIGARRDLRDAVRTLRAAPSFTLVAVAILAFATGAGTAIYSVVDAVVFRGLPLAHADRLVAIEGLSNGELSGSAPLDFLAWRADQTVFDAVATSFDPTSVARETADRQARRLRVTAVTADLFRVLGVQPQIGRVFTRDNEIEANRHVVLLSDTFWREQFGADPSVIGHALHLEGGVREIVGVMPPGFTYPLDAPPMDLWVPMVLNADDRSDRNGNRLMDSSLRVIARLKSTVTLAQAQSRLTQLAAVEAREHPEWFPRGGTDTAVPLKTAIVGPVIRVWMLVLLGAVGCVLLIACVNLANLFLARATVRAHELGIRAALGASRWQLARGLLVETLLLAAIGTGCGVVIAFVSVNGLRALLPPGLFRADSIAVNVRVLLASVGAALTTGMAIGVAPAITGTRAHVTEALREGGRGGTSSVGRQRLRTGLVIAELTLAVPLVVGAGLFLFSFAHLMAIDVGVDYHHVLALDVTPKLTPGPRPLRPKDPMASLTVSPDQARAAADLAEMADRARALPGVMSAAAIDAGLPLSGMEFSGGFTLPGVAEDAPIRISHVTREYPMTLRLPLLRGRLFSPAEDRAGGAPVVLLNVAAVERFFQGRNPLGAAVGIQGGRTVIGIVGNMRVGGPESSVRPEAYLPMGSAGIRYGYLVVRTAERPLALRGPLSAIVSAVAPDAKPGSIESLDETFSHLIAERRLSMLLFALFGVLAMAIAAVGVYGVVSYLVEQRTKEIGVRMALGATPGRILKELLGHFAWVLGAGVTLGLLAAWSLARFIAAFLFEVPAHAVGVYAAVSTVVVLSGLFATLLPARRAAKVDPLVALRAE